MATIKDVALLAKVGVGTASRAISGNGAVSPDALARVRQAVQSLEFKPSRTARALASKSLGMVGVYVPTFEGTYFAPILQAIESELRAHDQHMVAASNFGHGSRRSKSLNGLRFLIERECDGILSVDSYMQDDDLVALRKQARRLVLINRVVPGMEGDCFSADHDAAGRLAARALLAKGHRAIATMHSVRHSADVMLRMQGFRAELAAHGVSPAHEFIIDGLLNFANAWEQAGAIVAMAQRPFSALFCANDVLAMATLSRLQGAGIRVPQDLSVLGYDGAELGAYTSPALSSVRIDSAQLAVQACRHLINQCYGAKLAVQRSFDAELLMRDSVAPGPHPPIAVTAP
jgi:LacI family transcriptional regulator